MATLISCATGNSTDAATWAVVDTTSLADIEVNTANSTTAYVYSATFTPGAITVDGIALKFNSRIASPTGTFSVELYNNTDAAIVATVTVNASDFANLQTLNHGWYFFKFGSNQLLIAGKAYKVGIKSSVANTTTLYRTSTTSDWLRMLRTTTTAAPASGDTLHVIGEWTAAATQTTRTVTWNHTATTTFGSLTPSDSITVGNGGTLTAATSASTNYNLKWKGRFGVYAGGTINVGSSGTRFPSSSTFTFTADPTANVDTGMVFNALSTVNLYGTDKTTYWTRLTADVAISGTTLTVASTSGWVAGDLLCVSSTTRTPAEAEQVTIATVDSATQVTLSVGVTAAHSGTTNANGDMRAYVGNLTRNIKIQGSTDALQGYINIIGGAVVMDSVECYRLGSATANKRGIDVSASANLTCCKSVLRGFKVSTSRGIILSGTMTVAATISDTVFYDVNDISVSISAVSVSHEIHRNLSMRNINTGGHCFSIADVGSNVTNNVATSHGGTGNTAGFSLSENTTIGTFSNNTAVCCSYGMYSTALPSGTITNFTAIRNFSGGIYILEPQYTPTLIFASPTLIGNATRGMLLVGVANIIVNSGVFDGGVTLTQPVGISLNVPNNVAQRILTLLDCTFGAVNTHSTSDLRSETTSTGNGNTNIVKATNCLFASTTELTNMSNLLQDVGYISSMKHDQTANSNRRWVKNGLTTRDTTIFSSGVASARLAPTSSSEVMIGPQFKVFATSGSTITITVRWRKSVVGDGAAYNGNQPRLILRQNDSIGIAANAVIITATNAANGAWEVLSGTTATFTGTGEACFYVDCDGTAGWVNLDEISVSALNVKNEMEFWGDGHPVEYLSKASSGSVIVIED